jgi:nucleotidyltransferase substrate binding protein (TIGR01987 family)
VEGIGDAYVGEQTIKSVNFDQNKKDSIVKEETDIRWEQRFANFKKAMAKLTEAAAGIDPEREDEDLAEALSELEKEGLIQRFEYTHELAWNVMKDYLNFQGVQNIGASRDATREAFKIGLIHDGETWMDMIKSRNLSTHTYNASTAEEIYLKIIRDYYPLLRAFQQKMEALRSGKQSDIFSKEL